MADTKLQTSIPGSIRAAPPTSALIPAEVVSPKPARRAKADRTQRWSCRPRASDAGRPDAVRSSAPLRTAVTRTSPATCACTSPQGAPSPCSDATGPPNPATPSYLSGTAALRQTLQVPPSFAQRLHALQFLHALQGLAPVQVAACRAAGPNTKARAPSAAATTARRRFIGPAPLRGQRQTCSAAGTALTNPALSRCGGKRHHHTSGGHAEGDRALRTTSEVALLGAGRRFCMGLRRRVDGAHSDSRSPRSCRFF